MSRVVLVDGKNLVYRVHYVHRELASKSGKPTSVLFGVLDSLLSMAKRLPDSNWGFVWDGDGRTWRHELLDQPVEALETAKVFEARNTSESGPLFEKKSKVKGEWFRNQLVAADSFLTRQLRPGTQSPRPRPTNAPRPVSSSSGRGLKARPKGYKAHREALHSSDDHQIANQQIPELKVVLRNLGFRQFEVPRLEGDDLMGILVNRLKSEFDEVVIQSGDKDFYQFIGGNVKQLKRLNDGLVWADQREIENEFGIGISDWVRLKAIIGDPSDNIPHLFDRVGPATAATWIRQGVDPSLKDFSSHSAGIQQRYSTLVVRKIVVELEKRWPEVYRNYRLSKIITDVNAKEIRMCRNELMQVCCGLDPDGMRRDVKEDMLNWFSTWLVKLDMEEMYARRMEFASIP